MNLDVQRIAAVDGVTIGEDERDQLKARSSGTYPIGYGEMGCYLSHRKAWSEIARAGNDWAFVAEDDIRFSPSAELFFESAKWCPADADIIKAETHNQKTEVSYNPVAEAFGHGIRLLLSNHRGSAGYFVSGSAAQRLLKLTDDICDPLDEVLFNPELGVAAKLRIYQLDPAICIQDFLLAKAAGGQGFESTIEDDRSRLVEVRKRRKPRGLAKVKRELLRIVRKMRLLGQTATGRLRFKVIPFLQN